MARQPLTNPLPFEPFKTHDMVEVSPGRWLYAILPFGSERIRLYEIVNGKKVVPPELNGDNELAGNKHTDPKFGWIHVSDGRQQLFLQVPTRFDTSGTTFLGYGWTLPFYRS
jgi:hypothetical protein